MDATAPRVRCGVSGHYVSSHVTEAVVRSKSPPESSNESTPLLWSEQRSSYGISSRPTASQASRRPTLLRAGTTASASATTQAATSPNPVLSRPLITRSTSMTIAVAPPQQPIRPTILRRATEIIGSTLDLHPDTSYTHRNAPEAPTHWTDHAHRKAIVRVWDDVHAEAMTGKYSRSITAQVVSVEKQMLQQYGELAEGSVPLSREWIEYVLGVSLRHPFCTAESMGRFEVLAASGGARGNWGPWRCYVWCEGL